MKNGPAQPNPITVQIVVRDDCPTCGQVEKDLRDYCRSRKSILLEVLDLDRGDIVPDGRQSYITPAIWINDRLWSQGTFDMDRFKRRFNQEFRNNHTKPKGGY